MCPIDFDERVSTTMLYLSSYPEVAQHQLSGLVYYLTAFGMVDGEFGESEKAVVQAYLRRMLEQQAAEQMLFVPEEERRRAVDVQVAEVEQIISQIQQDILNRWTESISTGESQSDFVREYLELRCYEIFQSFEPSDRKELLAAVDELYLSDGDSHPAERELRTRLADLFAEGSAIEPSVVIDMPPPPVTVTPPVYLRPDGPILPFFNDIEQPYSADPNMLAWQFQADSQRVHAAMEVLRQKRLHGDGRLTGKTGIFDFAAGEDFLDGHVHILRPVADRAYELTVVGDLHGCYSCLKAILVQSQFFQRIEAFERSPQTQPEPRLVLLGDYVDRGRFSFDGVMRCVLKLLITYPRYVYALRGNHEWYRYNEGRVLPAVWPAEGYAALTGAGAWQQVEEYRQLFEALPHFLLFEQFCMVHAGAPPDNHLKTGFDDLSALNNPDLRMLALWGDPSTADVIPVSLQHKKTMRFSYGKSQLQYFLETMGCHSVIRGHEVVKAGFKTVYEDGPIRAYTLFSAGGSTNNDLPTKAAYRKITPMAVTIHFRSGEYYIQPWPIDFAYFNSPYTNGFYRT